MNRDLGRFYYRLALGAAARRDLKTALAYAHYACLLDSEHEDAAKLLAICRHETEAPDLALDQVRQLAGQEKWLEAAQAAQGIQAVQKTPQQSVRLLKIQGCLFAIAGQDAQAKACFAKALEKDGSDRLAASVLAELGRQKKPFLPALWGVAVTKLAGLRQSKKPLGRFW
ncbi:MAG: hypothetical protein LBT01_04940 [Spirochaetaceae bacterium]|jgi:tetratricopeptide (TPR) repeat protein|nr:hypothetical protein [Spirochaetaceae bacterium]